MHQLATAAVQEHAARSGTRMMSSLLSAADSCIGLMKQVNHILSLVPAEIRTEELVQEQQVKDNSELLQVP